VWIRGSLLCEQVISIVPQRDQTKIMNRGVRGGSIPDHHAHLTSECRQEGSIPRRRSSFGNQHGEACRTEGLRAGFAQPIKISLVGHDDYRAGARAS